MIDEMERLVSALQSAGAVIKNPNKSFCCPFHDDKNPSASIYASKKTGKPRFHCHPCNLNLGWADVLALASGRPVEDILSENKDQWASKEGSGTKMARIEKKEDPRPLEFFQSWYELEDTYIYYDTQRRPLLAVMRKARKEGFPQAHPVEGGWNSGGCPDPQPLFNQISIAKSDTVIVCEGEKDCKYLYKIGFCGTTSPMGADSAKTAIEDDGKPGHADWSPLADDKKTVILWGDFDEDHLAGENHMVRVQRIISRLRPRPMIRRVRKYDLDGCKDAADFIEKHGDRATREVLRVIESSEEVKFIDLLEKRFEDIFSGAYSAIPWPWPILTEQSQSMLPGSIVALFGSPGCGKTYFLLQAVRHWIDMGVKVAALELEEDYEKYSHRLLAMEEGFINVMNTKWAKANEEQARTILSMNLKKVNKVMDSIYFPDHIGMTWEQAAQWVEQKAKDGNRIIILDPFTALTEPEFSPQACPKFMGRLKKAVADNGATLVIVSHTRKGFINGGHNLTQDDMAGPAGLPRFISSQLGMQFVDMDDASKVQYENGSNGLDTWNRKITILKVRDGAGTNKVVCYNWIGKTARFDEVGIEIKEQTAVKGRK